MKLSPSMMCADIFALEATLENFEKNKIEYLHMDVMDGAFVPNYALGTDYCSQIKKKTSIPLDIHLMVENPEEKLDFFNFGEGDIVAVHMESSDNIAAAMKKIRSKGALAFATLNPNTPVERLGEVKDLIDGVLVMCVYPGFAGQKMVQGSLEKITAVREFLDANGLSDKPIEVDGNVSFENAVLMKKAGADIFVSGSSGVFSKSDSMDNNIAKLRRILK